ncbi:MAG TPA: NUDIX domain-containing protein [Patescibacteria group bacterium]|nr:NUDIX domain-containing protein [Patescibacteria group bacterium]
MHNIQRKILTKLLYAEALNYAAIRPDKVESNHFAYHLEQLLKAGLVIKKDRLYSLSPSGLALVDRMSHGKMVDRIQPHIVTAIQVTNDAGETLLYKRKFQPYFHKVGLPLGKVHIEESVAEAATRELEEKTGLAGIPLTHRGIAYIEAKMDDFMISKVLYHVFEGHTKDALPVTTNPERGECFWGDPTQYTTDQLMPCFNDVQKLLNDSEGLFFAELTAQI